MRTFARSSPLSDADRSDVLALLDESRRARGFDPLSEQKVIGLTEAKSSSSGVIVRDNGVATAYAHLEAAGNQYSTEIVTAPSLGPTDRTEVVSDLLDEIVAEVAGRGGGTLHYFLFDPSEEDIDLARPFGLEPTRELLVLRRATEPEDRQIKVDPSIRPFRPGADEQAWVTLNARAFSWHPEQGSWTVADLVDREHQPWFDPEGLLLSFRDGRLAGACWTKLHEGDDPVGEIYVISVDPDFQGRGLGRVLLDAGLGYLATKGVPATILYVEGDNAAAVGLYRAVGFENARRTVVASGEVSPE